MRVDVWWGQVIDAAASPPQMRWAGDSSDQPVALGLDGWTPADGDKVLLFRLSPSSVVAVPVVAL